MSIKINITNYEAFLLDHLEGNLSTEDFKALQNFAVQHPELDIDLNELELVTLNNDNLIFENKQGLKKSSSDILSNEQFISYIEKTLSSEEKNKVDALCSIHKELNYELTQYKKTIVSADNSIVFENKNELKKESKMLWLFNYQTLSAAATLLLLFGLWLFFKFNSPISNETILSEAKYVKPIIIKETIKVASDPIAKIENNIEKDNATRTMAYKNNHSITKTSNTNNSDSKVSAVEQTVAIVNAFKNETLINNSITNKESKKPSLKENNTQSYIITEKAFDEDENILASIEKKGFWFKAKKALNGLNKLGVKAVNGTETAQPNSEEVILSLGNFSIHNNKYNQP